MKKIIRLTESDLTRIIKRVISEKVEKTTEFDGVIITPPYFIIKLKKPTSDGFGKLHYIIETGELLGDGKEDEVIATIQSNLSKEQVIQWLEKNRIKVLK